MTSFESALLTYRQDLEKNGPNYADLLCDSLLTGTQLPTSKQIEHYLQNSREAEELAKKESETKKNELFDNIQTFLSHLKGQEDELAKIPEEIGTLEDTLSELCTELETRNDVNPNSSSNASESNSNSLLKSLSQQQSLLAELEAVQNYLSILAKAEDLKLESIKAEKERKEGDSSLIRFAELATLSKKVSSLAKNSSQSVLKAVTFVNSQKAQAFAELVKIRQDRLDSALKNAGWPPPPPEIRIDNQTPRQNENPETILRGSNEVRQAWRELMLLQRKSERAGVLKPSSAKIISKDDLFTSTGESKPDFVPSPGSQAYQPLLAVECLLKPLLLRFYYHFDSSRPTNRLDKPEWYLSHMLSVLRSNVSLFDPIKGVVASFCNNVSKSRNELRYDLSAELLHGLLRPLTLKLECSIDLLLQNPQLLSHTIMQTVQFDQDIRTMLMPIVPATLPIYLADSLLSKEKVFEAWVESERSFASDRLNEELESGGAWLIGDEDGVESEATEGSWAAMAQGSSAMKKDGTEEDEANDGTIRMKTTRSARAVTALVDGLTVRYRYLPSISHQLPFLLIQLSVLQGYAQRLERSLDAFESLSSAFSRAIPGAISGSSGSTGEGQGVSGGEADMVRGLRGLGRLLKACLSALYLSAHLSLLSSQSFFLMMGTSLAVTREGAKLMGDFRKWEGDEEERELDHASLGDLVRRGWRSGGRIASGMRPLGSNNSTALEISEATKSSQVSSGKTANETMVDVWEKSRNRFDSLAERALRAIEKMIISEVLEGMRTYSQRDWDEERMDEDQEEGEEGEKIESIFDIPTPSLLSSLSTLSTLLAHMLPSLPLFQANGVYRSIADGLSTSIVDRVIFSGGAHRFNVLGARRFEKDVLYGWMGVVNDVAGKFSGGENEVGDLAGLPSIPSPMGSRPQACWSYLLDSAKLISLTDEDDDPSLQEPGKPTLQQACRAAFEPTMAGPSWEGVVEMLKIDDRMQLRVAREILRRRTECPW